MNVDGILGGVLRIVHDYAAEVCEIAVYVADDEVSDGESDGAVDGVDVEGVRLNIHKDRRGACAGDSGGRRDEGDRGYDDLVALADAERLKRHLERDSTVHGGQAISAVLECGEFAFEARDHGMIAAPLSTGEDFFD